MRQEKVTILELEGGEVNILNAEKESVKLTKTGLFLCKAGSVTLTIDGTEYHIDVTWGDQSGYTDMQYFGMSAEASRRAHPW